MSGNEMGRRGFVKGAISAAMAAGLTGCATSSPTARTDTEMARPQGKRTLRLGAPVFAKPDDPEDFAAAHRRLGYRAAYCPRIGLNDTDRIGAFRAAFARHDVVLAEVGRWCNLLDTDPAKRRKNFDDVTDGLALAEAIGARCCVNIAGSYNPDVWYGPHPNNLSREFFDAAVENARKIIDAVQPLHAKLAYEMVPWSLPDSPDAYIEMIKAVDRDAFAVHVDICNLINSPWRFYNNTAVIREVFEKLGPRIVSCHAKDLTWDVEMNIHFREVPPGSGEIDYKTYLQCLAGLEHDVPLMVEHCVNEQEYDQARRYLLGFGPRVGVSFG